MGKPSSPLRNIRRARTLSQKQLADLAGIQQDQISQAENGKMRLRWDIEERIAAILGTPRAELFPQQDSEVSA